MATRIATFSNEGLPDVLYKFTPIETWLPDFFSGRSLRFSTRQSFNDPFDCRPCFRVTNDPASRKKILDGLKARGVSPANRIKAVNQIMSAGEGYVTLESVEQLLDEIGILCLTPHWDNALMWSHYAAQHHGICIGFRTEIDIFGSANPVIYADELPVVRTPLTLDDAAYDKVFLTKARCWEYEDEWRIIKDKKGEGERDALYREFCCVADVETARSWADHRGAGIYQFPNKAIECVILGMRSSVAEERDVIAELQRAELEIPVYRIRIPERTYTLVRDRVA